MDTEVLWVVGYGLWCLDCRQQRGLWLRGVGASAVTQP